MLFGVIAPQIVATRSVAGNTKTRKLRQIGPDWTLAMGGKHVHTARGETA